MSGSRRVRAFLAGSGGIIVGTAVMNVCTFGFTVLAAGILDTASYGDLGKWPVTVPIDGTPVSLQKPVITAPRRPLNAPEGPFTIPFVVTDERTLDHVVVFHNGSKVAWAPGAPRVEVWSMLGTAGSCRP